MKKLALLLLALPLSACASVNPECAYSWVDDSCGQYYLSYQYPRLAPGDYAEGSGYINGTGAPLALTHWGMASAMALISLPARR
jgi:hypothetical protein